MKNNTLKNLILVSVLFLGSFLIFNSVSASSSYFMPLVTTGGTATTTTVSIGAGIATTTLSLDSYTYGTNFATDRATLLVNHTSSSSASVLNISLQYSQNGTDWYDDNLVATTTGNVSNITAARSYSLLGNAISSSTAKAILVTTPTRYVRAVFTSTGATSTIFAQFVPMRQLATN